MLLDLGKEVLPREADVALQRFLDAVAMAQVGQQLCKLLVAFELALQEHSVEVENHRTFQCSSPRRHGVGQAWRGAQSRAKARRPAAGSPSARPAAAARLALR